MNQRWLLIIVSFLTIFSLAASGWLFYQNLQLQKQISILQSPVSLLTQPSPSSTLDPTANWKTYSFQGGSFKYPQNWNENPILISGSGFTQEIKDIEELYTFTLLIQGNYSQVTGKPYATLEEFIGPLPNILGTLIIDGQPAGRILPRAGSENKNAIVFFSKDEKAIYSLELDTNSSTANNVKIGQKLFDLILSTFLFTNDQPIDTSMWKTYTDNQIGFEFKYPSQLSLTESKQVGVIQTSANNNIGFYYISNDTSSTIAEFLSKADENYQTSWEGKPSIQVQSTKKTTINKLNCIQRKEYLTAADITQINTYFKNGSVVVSIALTPTPGNSLSEDESTYQQILSTFKFLDEPKKCLTIIDPCNPQGCNYNQSKCNK